MKVSVTLANATKGHRVYDEIEDWDCELGKVYKEAQKEYGRCTSSVYIDTKDGKTRKIGWTFAKRVQYSDCNETYPQEAWIFPVEVTPETVSYIGV